MELVGDMSDYNRFTELLKRQSGIDLSQYKQGQMHRRLTTFKDKWGYKTFSALFHAMVSNQELYNHFLDQMTINVTDFFRNTRYWSILEKTILPNLLLNTKKPKFWSAACSTGEEPYTLAMILSNLLDLKNVSLLATDLDQEAIEVAKAGIYSQRSIKEVPPTLLGEHFIRQNDRYYVSEKIKKCVKFQKHNLLADPYGKDFDLIVCRNVVIYFTEDAKEKLYHKFNRSLRKGGVLFVGCTEQILNPQKYGFELVDTFFYRKV